MKISAPVARALLAFLTCLSFNAFAHDPGLSSATMVIQPNKCIVTVAFSTADSKLLVSPEKTAGEKLNPTAIANSLSAIAAQCIEIKLDETLIAPTENRVFAEANNFNIQLAFPHKPFTKISFQSKCLSLLPTGHRQFVSIADPEKKVLAEALLSASADTLSAELGSAVAAPEHDHAKNPFANFLAMGVMHIWTGYDHLLFLFGLLVVTRNFKASLKIITCFTLAHSITLAVATLNLVQISSRIVEPLIAASIVFVGVENFLRSGEPKARWLLTFAFGLIHGFGFASALREMGVGENGCGVAMPLVSFNLGVELGQLAIAAIALPLIFKLRARPLFVARWVPACSTIVALLGGFWLVQRLWF